MVRTAWVLVMVVAMGGAGCSRRPKGPEAAKIDADGVASRAMKQYDTNGDGRIDAAELKQSPSLTAALARIDANHDGAITADEIRDRAAKWLKPEVAVLSDHVVVLLDGQPLDGATVIYEPEKFMGTDDPPAKDVTDKEGRCSPKSSDPKFAGLHPGLYLVRVSKIVGGAETLPERYNTRTELGREVAPDLPRAEKELRLELKSR
jgi:hypothetical protein